MRSLRLFWGPEGWMRGVGGGGAILARVSATDMGLVATVGGAEAGAFTTRCLGLIEPLFEDLRDCMFLYWVVYINMDIYLIVRLPNVVRDISDMRIRRVLFLCIPGLLEKKHKDGRQRCIQRREDRVYFDVRVMGQNPRVLTCVPHT